MKIFTKISLVCGAILCAATSVSAQDIIITNNDQNKELQVKIVEVQDNVVKYKKWTYQDGPTFTIATSDISSIKYQNGEEQQFSQKAQSKKSKFIEEKETTEVTNDEAKEIPYPKGRTSGSMNATYYFPLSSGVDAFALAFDFTFGTYVIKNLYVEGGLGIISNWAQSGSGIYDRITTTSTALSVPILAGYMVPFSKNIGLDFNTGPRLNYTVSGKVESNGETIKFKDIEGLKRFEAHWAFTLGVNLWDWEVGGKCLVSLREGGGEMFGVYIGWHF